MAHVDRITTPIACRRRFNRSPESAIVTGMNPGKQALPASWCGAVLALALLAFAPASVADEVSIEYRGLTLNGALELAPGKSIGDGLVVMLHGTLGHRDMEIIAALQETFLETGRSSLAVNLSLNVDDRHDFLSCDEPQTHRIEDAVDELAAWVSWLADEGAGDIVLMGHSRGGYQVARYLSAADAGVSAAILLAPGSGAEVPSAEVMALIEQAKAQQWLENVPFLHCESATVRSDAYLSYYAIEAGSQLPNLLLNSTVPVLVFAGSEDTVVSDLPALMSGIDRDDVRFIEIDGADHFFRDLYIYDVVEASNEFLDGL